MTRSHELSPQPAFGSDGPKPLAKLADLAGPPPAHRDGTGRFLTGNKGGGRPKGSKNRIAEMFLSAIAEDFAENGTDVISRLRETDIAAYMRLIASLIPRQLILQREHEPNYADMSIEEIGELLDRTQRNESVLRALQQVRLNTR